MRVPAVGMPKPSTWTSAAATERPSTTATRELSKQIRQISLTHSSHPAHPTEAFAIVQPILIVTQVIPFSPLRVRQHTMCLHHELELLLITTFIRVMLQTLLPIRLLDLNLAAVACQVKDLVVILGLAPLQCCLRLFQVGLQLPNIAITRDANVVLGMLNGVFVILNGLLVSLKM